MQREISTNRERLCYRGVLSDTSPSVEWQDLNNAVIRILLENNSLRGYSNDTSCKHQFGVCVERCIATIKGYANQRNAVESSKTHQKCGVIFYLYISRRLGIYQAKIGHSRVGLCILREAYMAKRCFRPDAWSLASQSVAFHQKQMRNTVDLQIKFGGTKIWYQ